MEWVRLTVKKSSRTAKNELTIKIFGNACLT